jgi:Flp pilus assembly pilin Flp
MRNLLLPLVVKAQVWKATRKANKGQGVIEYAGALVIAAVLVAAVINVGPGAIKTLFTNILTSVQSYFSAQMPK